jgi:hypothetical protein
MLISVDAGKYSTKAITIDTTSNTKKTFNIRTKLEEQGMILNSDGNTYSIEYEGKKYIIGDAASISDLDTSKTKLCHKIATYLSIAALSNVPTIDLVTGCPITQFINKETREEYANFLKQRNVQMKINNTNISFSINNITILPESYGIIMENASEYYNTAIGVIDIGGLNCSGVVYESLKPLKSSVFTINEGGNIIHAKIKRALNTAFLTNYQDYEIPYLKVDGKIKSVVDEVLDAQTKSILAECKKYNWNIGSLPLVFTGGGSLILDRQIGLLPNAKLSKNPIWNNANGYLKFMEIKH